MKSAEGLPVAQKNAAALRAFEAATEEVPTTSNRCFSAGLIRQQLGGHVGAVAAFSYALALAPRLVEAFYSRALSLGELSHADEALRYLTAAVALKPDYVDARYMLGITLERFDEAITGHRGFWRLSRPRTR